jgi:hypothetical protein
VARTRRSVPSTSSLPFFLPSIKTPRKKYIFAPISGPAPPVGRKRPARTIRTGPFDVSLSVRKGTNVALPESENTLILHRSHTCPRESIPGQVSCPATTFHPSNIKFFL